MTRMIAVALVLSLGACAEPAAPAVRLDVQKLPATVTIAEGRSVEVSGTIIGFDGVTSDSRCASDVVCVWAGNAELRITIGPAVGHGPVRLLTLNTNLEPRTSEEVHGFILAVVDLQPVPVSTGKTKDYRVTVRISRAP
jgi:hypothetical protein